MKKMIPAISLIGTYASHFLPLILSPDLSTREASLIVVASSTIFLTIFIASVFTTIYKFKYEIKSLVYKNETIKLQIDILKDESTELKLRNKELKDFVKSKDIN